jgi:hypothetical protein
MRKIIIDKDSVINDYLKEKSLKFLKMKYKHGVIFLKNILVEANVYVSPQNRNITKETINKIIEDYQQWISISKISKTYSIDRKRIVRILKENGIVDHQNYRFDFDRNIFKNIDNEVKAYWLGFLYADGSVYKSKDNISHHLTLKLSSKDIDHLYEFKKNFNFPQEIKLRKEYGFNKEFESARIRICSKEIVNDLISHGCFPNKTFTLVFPKLNEDMLNHFMRGYFDGDGSISISNNNKQITILGNYDFLKKYQNYLMEYCNINETKIGKKNKIYYLHYGGNMQIDRIKKFLYKNSTVYLKRKKEVF